MDKLSDLLSTLGYQESDELFSVYNEVEYNQLLALAQQLEQQVERRDKFMQFIDEENGYKDGVVLFESEEFWNEYHKALAQ